MTAQPIAGPYSLGATPYGLWRDNDGSLIIMAPDPDYPDDKVRVGCVNPTQRIKRGTSSTMTADEDPVQMATARLFVAAPMLASALLRIAEASPANANTASLAEFMSHVRAIANTALADLNT